MSLIHSNPASDADYHDAIERVDDTPDHTSAEPGLDQVIGRSRRRFLQGGLGAAVGAFFLGGVPAPRAEAAQAHTLFPGLADGHIGFKPLPPMLDPDFDRVRVPDGYRAERFFSWGDPVVKGATAWKADASDDWRAQAKQAGQNNDGMAYFPFPEAPNDHGLLVMNHEYINPTLHPGGFTSSASDDGRISRPEAEVKKEQAAHGVSVIEVRRDADGHWQQVSDSRFGRRITATTPIAISGPMRGAEAMKTASDPAGETILGTLNNCSMGATPWGTYLACEENWKNYFVNRDPEDYERRIGHKRYGVASGQNSEYYAWESVDARFNATPDDDQPHQGHVNETNRFGWVVEIDPFDPDSQPRKCTAMGRLVRECATVAVDDDGTMAVYSGDDTRGEYVYKYVPAGRYRQGDTAGQRRLLDEGTLYVAVFHEDGRGEWRALRHGNLGLTARNGFFSQQDVLVNARAAADVLGATPMDRPEWVAVHPHSKDVYVTLTNNKHRGNKPDQPVDAANPRPTNLHGQIVRWREQGGRLDATEFTWEVFLLAGDRPEAGSPDHLTGTIKGDIFSSPDGLWFDPQGRLWIQTDYGDDDAQNANMGTNQMLCADPATREVKRFLVGPRGCEVTGVTGTPDGRTLWVNIQHPGGSFPASDGQTRPRSSTMLVTRDDGGVIGT
ncbi:PhoX family protein [Marinobacter sp. JSM 1782161]|uniref:PhoX family protein n=1 Tax=Marinobacter sp. JSM 1782161 TaxID=2685906 RepID=UPI0014025A0A|nr:PhoX family phosphatase [Marinobacter sp. JSM 1782161]